MIESSGSKPFEGARIGGSSCLQEIVVSRASRRWSWIATGLWHPMLALIAVSFALPLSAQTLPEGNAGIAAAFPGDAGISSHSSVIFADDFESYSGASSLTSRWNEAYHSENIRIAAGSDNVFSGTQALEFTIPRTNNEISNTAVKYVNPPRDTLFVRFYAKYDSAFNVLGSSHNGALISANYCCPGVPANGFNKFLVSLEAGRENSGTANPGKLNTYIYYPEQRDVYGDHFFPTGIVMPFTNIPGDFGDNFVARPDFIPALDRWYSYELMVKANTPGQRNGRIAFWVDGQLAADFGNLRLRDTTALKIDRFSVDLHVKNNTASVARKWVDNVVAATSYIGPMVQAESLPAPTGLRILN